MTRARHRFRSPTRGTDPEPGRVRARGAADAPSRRMACCCQHPGHTHDETHSPSGVHPTLRWWIDVAAGGSRARVDLTRLAVVRVGDVDVVPLLDVWAAAHLGVPAEGLVFDFVGDDGFHLAQNDRPGVQGHELATGYVSVPARRLLWAPVPERPCYWRVKGVARVLAERAQLSRAASRSTLRTSP